MATCDKCKSDASMLWAINNGPALCATCKEVAAREARAADPEVIARQKQFDAEMAALAERQRIEGLRPPGAEHLCEIHRDHGPAEVLRGGLLLCRSCAAKEGPYGDELYVPPWPESPVLVLERRVAELSARLDALEGAKPVQAPKSSRKAAG